MKTMKTMKTTIQALAALLVAAVATTACSSGDDNIIGEQPTPDTQQPTTKYTMTVEATKGGDTRALSLDGTTLNATWTAGDKVEVWSSDGTTVKYGTLTAQSSGASTTLTGEMDFPAGLSSDLQLQLKYLSNDYSKQTGTLDYIAKNCDYATASVKVTGISDSEITTTSAEFQNQQAIIKFTPKRSDGPTMYLSSLTITDGKSTVTLSNIPDNTYETNIGTNLYIAFPATGSGATINITATAPDNITYTYKKSDVTLENGKYYDISVMMPYSLKYAEVRNIGNLVCAAGHLHESKKALPASCKEVGILGKVTSTGHGLIFSLYDAKEQTWNTVNNWPSVSTYANTTLKLLPDDAARGESGVISYDKLGETPVSNWAVATKEDYETIFKNLGSQTHNENGYTYDDKVNEYIIVGTKLGKQGHVDQDYVSISEDNGEGWYARWDYWISISKNFVGRVRPVLGF